MARDADNSGRCAVWASCYSRSGTGACASTRHGATTTPVSITWWRNAAPDRPATAPADSAPRPGHVTADGYSISSTALSLRGAPYRNGGARPGGVRLQRLREIRLRAARRRDAARYQASVRDWRGRGTCAAVAGRSRVLQHRGARCVTRRNCRRRRSVRPRAEQQRRRPRREPELAVLVDTIHRRTPNRLSRSRSGGDLGRVLLDQPGRCPVELAQLQIFVSKNPCRGVDDSFDRRLLDVDRQRRPGHGLAIATRI